MNPAFEATVTFIPPEFVDQPDASAASRLPIWAQRIVLPLQRPALEARDHSTGLYDRAGLFDVAAQAIRLQRADTRLSMIVVEFADLHEVFEIYGSAIARKVVARIVRKLRSIAGLRGFVGRTGVAQFTIVLPGTTQKKACEAVQRVFGDPARVEFDTGDSEIVLVPHVVVDATEPGAESIQAAHREMCIDITRTQKDEQRRLLWLASERERHSQPMSMSTY